MLLQRQSPSLRPITTAHLAQTMTLLSLTTGELREKIESELASNPALELVEEWRCPTCRRRSADRTVCPFCSRSQNGPSDEAVVFVSARDDFYISRTNPDEPIEDPYNNAAEEESLATYVMRQISTELRSEDRVLAAHILTGLNEDGLLTIPLIEIASYNHVSLSRLGDVLKLIQRADPVGVGSPTPQEALLIQLEMLAESQAIPSLADRAVREGMDLLSRHRYQELGQRLGIKTHQAKSIATFISENLNPYPGRAHWGEHNRLQTSPINKKNTYYFPDVIIQQSENSSHEHLVIEIVMPVRGTLRINPLFKEAIHQAPQEKSEQWKSDLEKAVLLVKCLQQRNHTLVRLMRILADLQKEFILNGNAHIQPITRAKLAKDLGVHESTVSRAVSGKAVQFPNRHILPMAVFFDRSLHIRTALKQIIEQENRPLSDTEIGSKLSELGFKIARRTVAKYRAIEGILPAHLRQLRKPINAESTC
jgi:RNA polymerase sigma-54 factor